MSLIGQRHGLMLLKRSVSRNYIDAAVRPERAIPTRFQRQVSNVNALLQLRQRNVDFRMTHSAAETNWITTKDESRELMAVWPDVVRDLTDSGRHLDIPEVKKWMAKVLQYNVPNGKKTRALALVYAYRQLVPPDQLTEENIRLTRILGWCVELLEGFLVVIDDIQDGSTIRRGQPAWYLHNDLGLAAINDGLLLDRATYQLLRTHFRDKECFIDLVNTFQEFTLKTIMGQCLDLQLTNCGDTSIFNLFTMDRYNSICNYKTSYYTFVLPVSLAMYFAGIKDREMHRQAETILKEMGRFFQVQDDYLDCYGDPATTGKIGTDIQQGKCTWLVVVALQRATSQQKMILEECYGSKDAEKIAKVKQLYNDLGLPNTYAIYEEESYNLLNTHIQQISRGLPHNLFLTLLNRIYRRIL